MQYGVEEGGGGWWTPWNTKKNTLFSSKEKMEENKGKKYEPLSSGGGVTGPLHLVDRPQKITKSEPRTDRKLLNLCKTKTKLFPPYK